MDRSHFRPNLTEINLGVTSSDYHLPELIEPPKVVDRVVDAVSGLERRAERHPRITLASLAGAVTLAATVFAHRPQR